MSVSPVIVKKLVYNFEWFL